MIFETDDIQTLERIAKKLQGEDKAALEKIYKPLVSHQQVRTVIDIAEMVGAACLKNEKIDFPTVFEAALAQVKQAVSTKPARPTKPAPDTTRR